MFWVFELWFKGGFLYFLEIFEPLLWEISIIGKQAKSVTAF